MGGGGERTFFKMGQETTSRSARSWGSPPPRRAAELLQLPFRVFNYYFIFGLYFTLLMLFLTFTE